jgi:type I restriction enzyme S subunit
MTVVEVVPLGEIAKITLGKTPPRDDSSQWDPNRTTANVWVSIADMTASAGSEITDSKEYIADSAAAIGRLVPKGTLLLSFKLSIGKLAFAGVDLYTNEAIAALHLPEDRRISKRFLYHYLSSVDWVTAAQGNEKVKGATLNKAKLSLMPIPVPPIEEQLRIVALLDKTIDSGFAYLKCLQDERATIIEHYQSAARSIFQDLLTEGVPETSIGDALRLIIDHRGKTPAKLGGDFTDSGVPVISAIHIKNDSIKWDERERFVTREMFELWMPVRLMEGDVLLTSEAPLGQVARVTSNDPLVLSQRLFALRSNPEVMSNDYLFEFLRSPHGQERLRERETGATAVGIRQSELVKIRIPVPDLEIQAGLAERLSVMRALVFDLLANVDARIAACNELIRSTSSAAFRGEL